MSSLDLNNTYMKFNDTKKVFPDFRYNEDSIPLGNSILICISLHWATEDKGLNFPLTSPVTGFSQCEESKSGKFIWNDDDPKFGIDIPVWTQHEVDVDCTDQEDCESTCEDYDALFLNGKRGKKCFSYKILKSICLAISYNEVLNEYVYKGGCFEGGSHYLLESPVKNQEYFFDNILFEVRNYEDPIIRAGEMSNYSYSFGASMVSILFKIILRTGLLIF